MQKDKWVNRTIGLDSPMEKTELVLRLDTWLFTHYSQGSVRPITAGLDHVYVKMFFRSSLFKT